MKRKTIYTEMQSDLRYQKISESKAAVIVNEFICEETMIANHETMEKQVMFAYMTNTFFVNPMLVTEDEIRRNLKKYLDYISETEIGAEESQMDFNIETDYRISMLELGLV